MRVNKYIRTFKILLLTFGLVVGSLNHAQAAKIENKANLASPTKAINFVKLAAVDLSKVLPYIMGAGDVFQGYEVVNHKGQQAFKLRIFNQHTGRIRYVYINMQTGVTL
ncbi:MAG: hypothetical protein COB24_00335 [Hyphomicrobiales bacterium]|nr:MAG: hypothetical protein COB24_00335 [Hyphomicrobiales bacterium]